MTHLVAGTVMPDTTAPTASCPKCATTMVPAAITPHPIVAHMERHTFLCAKCNQTKTYMLLAQVGRLPANETELS
jgi:hypothetical protein